MSTTTNSGISGTSGVTGNVNVESVNLDTRDMVFGTDKMDVSGSSVAVTNHPTSIEVSNLVEVDPGVVDIRALQFEFDSTDVSGSTVNVSGTVQVNTSLTPLTDAQLRATSVPVIGVVDTGIAQPLTDAQIRATPLPVSGTVTANTGLSQPLTDTQLRASVVPVSLSSTSVSNFPATQPVSGTVTANTGLSQPLTDTQLRAAVVPVSLTSTTVTNFPATQAVTGAFFQATQPVSAAALPLPTGASTETTLSALNTKVTAVNTGAVTISAVPTLTKAAQGAQGFSIQDIKDAGRVLKMYSATFTGATTEAMATLTPITDGVAGASGTSFTVTAGKLLRIQSISVSTRNAGAAGQGVVIQLRMNPSGAAILTSPLIGTVATGTKLATANVSDSQQAIFPDGLVLSGAMQFGVSRVGSATANNTVVIVGYEY